MRDIWKQEGQIDEIHIELGRNLKQNAEQRKRTLANQTENEKHKIDYPISCYGNCKTYVFDRADSPSVRSRGAGYTYRVLKLPLL